MAAQNNASIRATDPMSCKGDSVGNWDFFQEQQENYEMATRHDEKPMKVRIATSKAVMGKDCLSVLKHMIDLSEEDKLEVDKVWEGLGKHIKREMWSTRDTCLIPVSTDRRNH